MPTVQLHNGTFEVEEQYLGGFTLDPASKEFKRIKSVCEPGNPWRCLIATAASIHVGRRVTVRLDMEHQAGTIGLTYGGYRFIRPMTAEEVAFATKFDLERQQRKPLDVVFNLGDGTWSAYKKKPSVPAGKYKATAKPRTKTLRQRQLEAVKREFANDASIAQTQPVPN